VIAPVALEETASVVTGLRGSQAIFVARGAAARQLSPRPIAGRSATRARPPAGSASVSGYSRPAPPAPPGAQSWRSKDDAATQIDPQQRLQ
jgi:hypothetical protein